MIYLDNAATTYPKPEGVQNAIRQGFTRYFANPGRGGYTASVETGEAVFRARQALGETFHCPADRVVFTQNCTMAINLCLKGILRPGDHVVCSSLEHNAVLRPLYALREQGVQVDVAEVIFGDPQATVRSFERLIRRDTKLLVCMHASNVLGTVLPIAQIGALAHEKGIPFLVDAAQTAGILPIDMEQMQIDYLAIAPHKGLYAPMGTGVLLCRGAAPLPLIHGGTGTESKNLKQPENLPERLESGTINVPGIFGISAGLSFVEKKGMDQIYRHEFGLIRRAYQSLQHMDRVRLYTDEPELGACAPVLSFNLQGVNSEDAAAFYAKQGIAVRGGLHCAPMAHKHMGTLGSGAVRIAVSAFSTNNEVDRFLRVTEFMNFQEKKRQTY